MADKQIKDLIKIPEVKTIIQMSDINDPELQDFLTESFLLTDEVEKILFSFFNDLMHEKGKGYFIEGNFGSGKSHLLSVLSLLLSYEKSWSPILEQLDENSKLADFSKKIKNEDYIVLNISLVEHSNREYLENIVISKITKFFEDELDSDDFSFSGEKEFIEKTAEIVKNDYPNRLKSFLRENKIEEDELFSPGKLFLLEKLLDRLNLPYRFNFNRQDIFAKLADLINESDYSGIVILVDELSEFLRSKPDGRRFNEDIRFLQFLGEFTARVPCWIAATLQEEIEKTGETTPEAFNKIKDRYPTRFHLTGAHIKEIISKRLIKLKEGAEFEIKDVYDKYNRGFKGWQVSEDEFIALYPIHPLTVDLLDNLKPLFSQHRGIIDFIHYQLKGDESRHIEGMMDQPADILLTPDYIFDHFTSRIKEMIETNPYYEKVYRYYRQEIDSILNEDQLEIGLKIIKLLILFSISPVKKDYDIEKITHMLLVHVTDLEAEVNYDYINDILERLYKHGAYLVSKKGEETKKNKYYIDLDADVNLIIKRRMEYIKSNLFAEDSRVFTRLAKEIEEDALPLKSFFANPKTKRKVYWQNTEREGFVYFIPFTEISIDNLKKSARRFLEKEEDFMFFIGHAHQIEEQKEYLEEVLLPELSDQERELFMFWLPQELEEKDLLKDALSRLLLLDEYKEESSDTAREIKEQLQAKIAEDKDKITQIFRYAYYQGELIDGREKEVISLENITYLPFKRLLRDAVSNLLERRFPKHHNISPYQQVLTQKQIDKLIEQFLIPGEIDDLKKVEGRVINVIDSYLKPMGLIKKQKNSIKLKINADKNPLIKRFFSYLENEKTEIKKVYQKLRKGKYGLSYKQFKLVVYALLYSGYLTAYSSKQKISLKHLNARNFGRIKFLGYGEIIQEDFQKVLAECELLPPRYKKQTFSLPLQQEIWDYLTDKKKELTEKIARLREYINRLKERDYNHLPLTKSLDIIKNIENLLVEIKVSYSSEEGLERFASEYRNRPNIENKLEKFELIEDFIENKLRDYKKIKRYLDDKRLKIAEGDKYKELRELKERLMSSLKNDGIVFEKDFFADFQEQFSKFQEKYIEVYRKEHKRQLASDRFQKYEKIKESKSYELLKSLSKLRIISVKDDLIKVDRLLAKALRKKCNDFSVEELKERPVCDCGFQLGEKIELPSRKKYRTEY